MKLLLLLVIIVAMQSCASKPGKLEVKISNNNGVFIEKIVVPATTQNPTISKTSLSVNKRYRLEVSGTYLAGDTIEADADYSVTKKVGGDFWTDPVSKYEKYGERLLNLLVHGYGNNGSIEWGAFNENHIYNTIISGEGSPLQLVIYDIYDSNNSGGLTLKIYELK